MGSGGSTVSDKPYCAAGTRQRGIWGAGFQLFMSILTSWGVCGLGGSAVTPE